MNPRNDLLELSPQALTALANAGFVKRAQREVAAGQLPELSVDEQGVVTAVFDDGVQTRFPLGVGLQDAQCNCPASGMCRHRVSLVLAWQARAQGLAGVPESPQKSAAPSDSAVQASDAAIGAVAAASAAVPNRPAGLGGALAAEGAGGPAMPSDAFSPADFDDVQLSAALGSTALAQATRFAAQQPTVRVQPWQGSESPPVARLPMCTVRFFSRHSLHMARCDCVAGGRCAHVALAVWAFRQAQPEAGGAERVLTLHGPVSAQGAGAAESVSKSPEAWGTAAEQDSEGAEYAVPDAAGDAFGLRAEAGLRARASLDALLLQLWLDGAAQPQLALASRFTALRTALQALGWQWVLDALDELEQQVHALLARSTRFDPARMLDVSAELWARCRGAERQWLLARQSPLGASGPSSLAAHEALSAAEVLGRGVRGEVPLDHLRLVSLGGSLWSDLQQEGASVFLADPDTQSLLVLERAWPKAAADASAAHPVATASGGSGPVPVSALNAALAAASATGLLQRRVVGVSLRQLMESQIITKAAKRRANGVVDIGGTKRQTGVLPLSPTAWQDLSPPLAQPGVVALSRQLMHKTPAFVAPRQAISGATAGVAGSMHVLHLQQAQFDRWWWDGATQCVHAMWHEAAGAQAHGPAAALAPVAADAAGLMASAGVHADAQTDGASSHADHASEALLHVQLRYSPEAPGAVDALAKALAGQWGPVLAVAGMAWRANGRVCLHPTALICAQRAVVLAAQGVDAQAMPAAEQAPEPSLRELALRQALAHLGNLLRDGVRHQGGLWPQTMQELANLLQRAGFAQAAQLLSTMRQEAHSRTSAGLLGSVSRLTLLLRELQAD